MTRMAGAALAIAAVAVVILAVVIIKMRRDFPEVLEWKQRAATATKAEFRFEIDEAFAIQDTKGVRHLFLRGHAPAFPL